LDRIAPVISLGRDVVHLHTRVRLDWELLPEGDDGSWQREQAVG
jgi:hypothetical protein